MKYRKLTENGDYAFGRGGADMHADTPEAVGQPVYRGSFIMSAE